MTIGSIASPGGHVDVDASRKKQEPAPHAQPPAEAQQPKATSAWTRGLTPAILFSIAANLLMLTGPLFMLQVYDRVLASGSMQTLVALGLLTAMLYGFYGLMESLRSRIMIRVGALIDRQFADRCFALSIGSRLKKTPNQPSEHSLEDLRRVRQFLAGPGMINLFDLPFMPLYLGVVFLLHPLLGMTATLAGALLVLVTVARSYWTSGPIADAMDAEQGAQTIANQTKRQIESITAMGMAGYARRRWHTHHHASLQAGEQAGDGMATASALSKTLRLAVQSLILAVGAYLAVRQEITPGAMIAASIIFSRAFAPFEQLTQQWKTMNEALRSRTRLKSALAATTTPDLSMVLPLPKERLCVEDLEITAPGAEKATLQGITFTLKAGDGLGVIGHSGCGKTSLARALVGAWDHTAGEFRLDGATLDQWSEQERGRMVGYLPQDVELFDGTIAENISRLQPKAREEDVLEAARVTGAHELIVHLPNGYDTLVGPNGLPLSGGQRQRIGLARAVFGNPFLVVLDEPNANLDAVGDRALQQAIRHLRESGSIVIVIAHRPSAVAELNQLLWLSSGGQKIVGPKDAVLAKLNPTTHQNVGGLHVV